MSSLLQTQPLISVIIPSYNRAHLLSRAVNSVIIQKIQEIEIIIADDGSTDNTEDEVKKLKEECPYIIYVRNPINKGEAACRNLGIKAARGKYIAFLDSDDAWLPGKLEEQIKFLMRYDMDYDAVTTNYYQVDEAGNQVEIKPWFPETELTALNLLKRGCNVSSGTTMVVKSSVVKKNGYFDESLPIFVDLDWLCRFCENGYKMGKIQGFLALYFKASMRSGEFLEMGVKRFKIKNSELLKKFSLFDRALIESQFYGYISHSYFSNGPFNKFLYSRFLCILLNPFMPIGNHIHLLVTVVKYIFRKMR